MLTKNTVRLNGHCQKMFSVQTAVQWIAAGGERRRLVTLRLLVPEISSEKVHRKMTIVKADMQRN